MTISKDILSKIDIDDLLEQRKQVAIIWCVEDVQEMRPDLSEDQAFEVLLECKRAHDGEIGFTWTLIQEIASDMFPRSR
ncbi:MAG: hypothetical protein HY299_02675 [Verrucomicrobia bacterium]|nr:hypothetical protein [Verrucomicrobiota bacterium]